MKFQDLPIKKITRDEDIQSRVRTDDETAGQYALDLRAGDKFPEPVVFDDGQQYWLADGWHTVRGHELNREKTVRVRVVAGTRRDAILYAVGANARHGRRRTPEDMRKAVRMLLEEVKFDDRMEWPNTRIASLCHVSEGFVRVVKKELKGLDGSHDTRTEEGENCEEAELADDLSPAEAAVFASMSEEEIAQQMKEAEADAIQDRVKQAEDNLNWIIRELGESKSVQDLRKLATELRTVTWAAAGREKPTDMVITPELQEQIKLHLDRYRKAVHELPGGRNLEKRADYLWQRVSERVTAA